MQEMTEAEAKSLGLLAPATAEKYGKVPMFRGLFSRFPYGLEEVAKVSQFGTAKHKVPINDMGFMDIPDAMGVYSDALTRHVLEVAKGHYISEVDGQVETLAQIVWNALAMLEIRLRTQRSSIPGPG